jgi:RNA polymerase sigma factor (sigma-70 family)
VEEAERAELQRLMADLATGDRSAFRPVFDRVWPLSRDLARRLLNSPADADDAAQEAVTRIFFRAAEFDTRREALPWILGIVANECRSLRKKAKRRREDPGPDRHLESRPDGGSDPEEQAMNGDLARALDELLGTLRPADLETVLAAARGDRRPVDGIAPATFRKRLQRAVVRLREAWRTRHGLE